MDTEKTEKWLFRMSRAAVVFKHEVPLTFLIVWKTSSTAMGITPGKCSLPIMVNVFPEDVCPYAKIVPDVYTQHSQNTFVIFDWLAKLALQTIVSFNSGDHQRLGYVLVQIDGCFLSCDHPVWKQAGEFYDWGH